jgi:hypothetical protein
VLLVSFAVYIISFFLMLALSERLLHRPGERQGHAPDALRDPPPDGEADRGAPAARGSDAARHRRVVGFLDALLGGRKKLKAPAADRLFAMTTAHVAMETEFGLKTRGSAGIVFQQIATADFKEILTETKELLQGSAEDTGTTIEEHTDEHGYRWLVLRDDDFEDLVVAINTVSSQLQLGGYGDRLLAAVFAFDDSGRPAYFIYNFKRGAYSPFVPKGGKQERDNERELQLKAQLEGELPFEQDLGFWYALWDIPL